MADQFHLSTATSLSTVRWWGSAANELESTGLTDFVITIFNRDSGSLPGTTNFSESIAVGTVIASADAAPDKAAPGKPGGWKYEANLSSGHNLGAGDYFFSVYGKASSINGAIKWVWQGLLDGGDGAFFKSAESGMWADAVRENHPVNNLAWQLEGTIQQVPLPMPVLLGGLGLLGVIPLRQRMKRRATA